MIPLDRYDVVGFDTETNGVDVGSRPVGCSIALPDGKKFYAAWGHPEGNNTTFSAFSTWARRELAHPHITYIGHNAIFDMRMLAYAGAPITGRVECTQTLATLLDEHRKSYSLAGLSEQYDLGAKSDEKLNDYCARTFGGAPTRKAQVKNYCRVPGDIITEYAEDDAALTLKLYQRMRDEVRVQDLEKIYALETTLIPVLLRMHLAGVRVDRPRAKQLQANIRGELAIAEAAWKETWGEVNYRSADELQVVLDELGVKYPLTPRTKKPSITKEYLEALTHPIGQQIRHMRQLTYFADVPIQNYMLNNCTDDNDVIHPEFHAVKGEQYGTRYGRLSSGGALNAQNLPSRDEYWAPAIRSGFRPMRDDMRWLKIDYSQIEYRFFAHYAGELARGRKTTSPMEEAYIANARTDFHQWVADVAGIPRRSAKNVNFCKLYGGGVRKIAVTAGVTLEEAAAFVEAYEAKIPEAAAVAHDIESVAVRRGYIRTWGGRRCRFESERERYERMNKQPWPLMGRVDTRFDPPRAINPNRRAMTYAALNRTLQGSAADLIKMAMIEVDKAIDWQDTIMHLSVHDELDFSVDNNVAKERKQMLVTIMQDVALTPSWNGHTMRVPVIAEAELGNNWGMI